MVGKIKSSAIGLSLIKGFDVAEGGGIELISHIITKHLKVLSNYFDSFIQNLNLTSKLRFHALS